MIFSRGNAAISGHLTWQEARAGLLEGLCHLFSPGEEGWWHHGAFRARIKAVELQQTLQILGKQAARKDTKSTWEMEGLEKTLAPFWDLPLGLVCWRADEPS